MNLKVIADAIHPRIDTVRIDGEVCVGTPTAGATLSNRLGAANVPSHEVDWYVLVSASSGFTASEASVMPNLWTPELDAAVARIEAELEVAA